MAYSVKNHSARSGFTLVELLVVMMILAISAAVIIPYAIGTNDMQASSAARMVVSDLQYAQDTAIVSQTPVTVTFNASSNSYSLSNTSGPLIHPMTKEAYIIDFTTQRGFGQLDIVSASFGGAATVTYDEMGSPDNAGTVTLQAGPHVYQISVAAAIGKVTVTSVGP